MDVGLKGIRGDQDERMLVFVFVWISARFFPSFPCGFPFRRAQKKSSRLRHVFVPRGTNKHATLHTAKSHTATTFLTAAAATATTKTPRAAKATQNDDEPAQKTPRKHGRPVRARLCQEGVCGL